MKPEILRFIRYLSFKMDCLRYQEENPLTLNVEKAQKHSEELADIIEEKTEALSKVMPKVVSKWKNKPKDLYKKDGSYSVKGKEWIDTLKSLKLPMDTEGPIPIEYKDGNPGSSQQVKDWLDTFGWEPDHYKFTRNKVTGEEKKIPQIRYSSASDPRKGQLTDSVLKLKDKEPAIEILEGLTVAQHRKSIFDGFLKSHASGMIVSSAGGFTNTLRLKHRAPLVNLPKVGGAWGKEIRGCLVAASGEVLCGSDVTSLEDSTKRHFLWDYDPEYVKSMDVPGFDPHMTLLVYAGKITQEDYDFYVDCKQYGIGNKDPERFKTLDKMRHPAKTTNYSSTYKVGAKKLARETGMSVKEAQGFLDAFWKLNWGIVALEKDQYIKTLKDGSMYLKNPISGFYYSLRFEKDCFSTLNQSTGVFIFDNWVMRMRKKGIHPQMQYHDEVLRGVLKGNEQEVKQKLEEAMKEVNESLKLNVDITVDVQFGEDYASVH